MVWIISVRFLNIYRLPMFNISDIYLFNVPLSIIYLPIQHLSIYLFICSTSIYLSIQHLSIYLSICSTSIYLFNIYPNRFLYLILENMSTNVRKFLYSCNNWHLWRLYWKYIFVYIYLFDVYLFIYSASTYIYLSFYSTSFYLSILHLYINLFDICLSIRHLSIYLFDIYLYIYSTSIYLSIRHISIYLFDIYLSIYSTFSTYLSDIYLSIYLSDIYLSIYPTSIYLSIWHLGNFLENNFGTLPPRNTLSYQFCTWLLIMWPQGRPPSLSWPRRSAP